MPPDGFNTHMLYFNGLDDDYQSPHRFILLLLVSVRRHTFYCFHKQHTKVR